MKKNSTKKTKDIEVTKPKHYTQGPVECIDAIDSMLDQKSQIDFCRAQVLKYNWRMFDKGNPVQDAQKAKFYQDRLVPLLKDYIARRL
jgi:hypothetical protein|tara:strand:+ start:3153 stop:3416 length:264 start_codon:yes stop_codon:yes gene_type:complete